MEINEKELVKPTWIEISFQQFKDYKVECDPNNILMAKIHHMSPKSVTVWVNPDMLKKNVNFMEHWFYYVGREGEEDTKYYMAEDKQGKIVVPTENPYIPPPPPPVAIEPAPIIEEPKPE